VLLVLLGVFFHAWNGIFLEANVREVCTVLCQPDQGEDRVSEPGEVAGLS